MIETTFDYRLETADHLLRSLPHWGPNASGQLIMLCGGRLRKTTNHETGVVTLHLVSQDRDFLPEMEQAVIAALGPIAEEGKVYAGENQRSVIGGEGHAWIVYYPKPRSSRERKSR